MLNLAKRILSTLVIGVFVAFAGLTISTTLAPVTGFNTVQGAEEEADCDNMWCEDSETGPGKCKPSTPFNRHKTDCDSLPSGTCDIEDC